MSTTHNRSPLNPNPYESIATSQHVVLPDGTQPLPMGSGVICGILGEGGVAIVYEVHNERLGVKRAVKVLKPNASTQSLSRFETEMRITAQLRHPHVVEIHSVGDWNGLPYLEMERIYGVSLDKIIKERGALPLPMVLAIGIMVCRALEFTHNHTYRMEQREFKGILHRDLKPANIMVANSGLVKLTDFGIARPTDISLHTMEGDFVGSLQYVSPEQLHGKPLDSRADIFSLGCVLYEMITGVKAFPEVNVALLATSRLKNHYRALRDVHTRIPRSLSKIVQTCLMFDQADRFSTVTPIRTELERLLAQITTVRPEEVVEYFTSNASSLRVLKFKKTIPPVVFALAGGAFVLAAAVSAFIAFIGIPETPAPSKPIPAGRTDTIIVTKTDTLRMTTPFEAITQNPSAMKPAPAIRPSKTITDGANAAPSSQKMTADATYLSTLESTYQTSDIRVIVSGLRNSGNHTKILEICSKLPQDALPRTTSTLFQARALEELGRTAALKTLLQESADLNDAELNLMKVRIACTENRYADAIGLLKKTSGVPAELITKDSVEHAVLYYTAVCRSGIFRTDESEANRQAALDSWFNVKYAFRAQKGHPYFEAANKEIRVLTP